jgi:hypothetical protein
MSRDLRKVGFVKHRTKTPEHGTTSLKARAANDVEIWALLTEFERVSQTIR